MAQRPRVFVTRRLPGRALQRLAEETNVEVWPGDLPPPREEFALKAQQSEGLLTLLTDRVDADLLDAAPKLLTVSNMATGYDNIDVPAATERGVLVTRTPGVLSETTADFAFALMLAAARRAVEGDRYVREGQWITWGPETLLGQDVYGATLGIVGLGGIGREVAKRARGFGMRVLYAGPHRKEEAEREFGVEYRTLEDLLSESDFVSLHAPLTSETKHMINERTLQLMKPTAVLINTSRGPLVDQTALYEALRDGVIFAAALDVTDPEPISPDDPLLTLSNVIITPHMASASVATRSRMALLAAENLLRALRGEIPENAVNPEVADKWRERVSARLAG